MTKHLIRRCYLKRGAVSLVLGALLVSVGIGHAESVPDKQYQLKSIDDLHYGEVLFDFYQDHLFSSIVKLNVAQAQKTIPHHREDGQLLKGGLSLAYGMQNRAEQIFTELLNESKDPNMRNRAWFYLGKAQYQRESFTQAQNALEQVDIPQTDSLGSEKNYLLSQLALMKGEPALAADYLKGWEDFDADWRYFALYNLGVAQTHDQKKSDAIKTFEEVATARLTGELNAALLDRANLTAGIYALKSKSSEKAAEFFRQVRLHQTASSKALLGLGWALSDQKKYERALVTFEALSQRDFSHPAVQEAYIAIARTYARMEQYGVAINIYQQSVNRFRQESGVLDDAKAAILGGGLTAALLDLELKTGSDWFSMVNELPEGAATHYLPTLLAQTNFVEALKNYYDLLFMAQNLSYWSENMSAFGDMLATRKTRFENSAPVIEKKLRQFDLSVLSSRKNTLALRFDTALGEAEGLGLASAKERADINQLDKIAQRVEQLDVDASSSEVQALNAKQQFLNGVMQWEISKQHVQREWAIEKSLKQIDKEIDKAAEQSKTLRQARGHAVEKFSGFNQRIINNADLIAQMQKRVNAITKRQAAYISALVVDELNKKQLRVQQYAQHTQLALAKTYHLLGEQQDAAPEKLSQ